MYKVISMDFDDTILTKDKKVSKYSEKVLNKYKKEGYIIVGVTGRNLSSAKDACDISLFNYLILNNGSILYNVKTKKVEFINLLSKTLCKKITKQYNEVAIKYDYCSINNYYMTRIFTRNSKPFLKRIKNISEVDEDICKMNIFLKDNGNIEAIRDDVNSNFEVNAFIMQDSTSIDKWIVINPKNLNKSTTLELLCKKYGLTLENAIFFGDGLNDLELIRDAGLGVAMGNALSSVKKLAKDVALTNEQDGVAKYLVKLLK